VAELFPVQRLDDAVEGAEQVETRAGDAAADESPVAVSALPRNQPHLIQAVEQACRIGDPGHQPVPDLVAAEPLRPGAAQDAERVVLCRREPVRLERLGGPVLQHGGSARDTQHGLLLEAAERFPLLELG
jgi:hypothetical protein